MATGSTGSWCRNWRRLSRRPAIPADLPEATGAGAGTGHAAALQFAAAGARVVITGRREAQLQAAAAQHPNIDYIVADAGKADDAARTVATTALRYGRLDVLVND